MNPDAFAARLAARLERFGPLTIGVDPSPAALATLGLPDRADGAFAFGERLLLAARYDVAIVKPQVAFFERFGSEGFKALEELIALARTREVLVLADAKRGDIDSTAAAYADAWFGGSRLRSDALTVHAYLGYAALRPIIDRAHAAHGGVFVVVRSSNPEGATLQRARDADGATVATALARAIRADNQTRAPEMTGAAGAVIGAVIGATSDEAPALIDALGDAFVLAPGIGAQGASFADVSTRFQRARGRVLANVSRGLLANGGTRADLSAAIDALGADAKRWLG